MPPSSGDPSGAEPTCASCGRPAPPGAPCPHCGHQPERLAADLANLDQELSQLAAQNLQLDQQRKDLAGKMQVAKHQRDVLARSLAEQRAPDRKGAGGQAPGKAGRPPPVERLRRRVPVPRRPARAATGRRAGADAPADPAAPVRGGRAAEASSGSVQALMLGLGALLLGIAAVVSVSAAISAFGIWGLLATLVLVTVIALALPPVVARRGLVATAETISAVGLLLVGVVGYGLWTTGVASAVPVATFAGLVAAGTATTGYGYHRLTGLAVPRSAGLLALQAALPLLAYHLVTGLTGWAILFTLIAAGNVALGRWDRDWTALAGWQPHLAWLLHGVALGAATGYAGTALATAGTVTAATAAGAALVAATSVAVLGTLSLRYRPLPDLAAGLMTAALVLSAARVAVVALPHRALLLLSVVAAGAGLASRLLPASARRGPQITSAVLLALLGALVAVLVAGAASGTIVLPAWPAAPTTGTQPPSWVATLADGRQLAVVTAVLTTAATVSLPAAVRREGVATGVALTALAVPVSLGLAAPSAAWLLVAVSAGLGLAAAAAPTRRAAVVELVAAGVVALVAAGAGLATPILTAGVLTAVTVTGVMVAAGPSPGAAATTVSRWASSGALLTLPGATATIAAAAGVGTSGVLAAACAGVCVSLGYAVWVMVARRLIEVPVTIGAGAGAVLVALVAVLVPDATPADLGVVGLLIAAAGLTYAVPRMDATRRRDRLLDGADLAAAAVTVGVVATLARVAWLALPITGGDVAATVAGTLVTVVALTARALPGRWRRGPVLGVSLVGAVVASLAAAAVLPAVIRIVPTLWEGGPAGWPPGPGPAALTWGAPVTLVILAVAAATTLPPARPHGRLPGAPHASAALAVLAAVGAPLAWDLPWWGPATVAAVVATGYAAGAAGLGRWGTAPPRVARARAVAAAVLAVYAGVASVAVPGQLAVVLGAVVLVGVAMAALTATLPGVAADPRAPVGGVATAAVLLATAGALATIAAYLGHSGGVVHLAALAGCGIGLAGLAALHRRIAPFLPYATVGIAAGASVVALAAVPTAQPGGLYGAAAVLLGVVAELVRVDPSTVRADGSGGPPRPLAGWVNPSIGALLVAAVPATIAVIEMAPALRAALVEPYEVVVTGVWRGPPPTLLATGGVPATTALAALLLTLAAALAAAGFGGAVTRQAAPVVAPGLALTLLIAPAGLAAPWPSGTVAALVVFTLAMLGVALTPPPRAGVRTRVLRWARAVVLIIGLAGGGAGLAGSLAEQQLTLATLGGAVAVGAAAGLGGRTRMARLLGWFGAAAAASLFALTAAAVVGATRHQAALFLLPVAAVALLLVAPLGRMQPRTMRPERGTVEWSGGYIPLLLAVGLGYGSPADLALVLAGTGLVLAASAVRPSRSQWWERGLLWAAVASEAGATWISLWLAQVRVLEAYTVPLALFALLVGLLERRRRADLTSWFVYGPALVTAFLPSLAAILALATAQPGRHGGVLLAGTAALIFGSRRRQRAPVILGTAVTALAALHLLSLAGPWLVLIPLGVLLLVLGANFERRRRELARIRGALDRMR